MNAPYPSTGNLLQTVQAFLEDLRPTLTGEPDCAREVAIVRPDHLAPEHRPENIGSGTT